MSQETHFQSKHLDRLCMVAFICKNQIRLVIIVHADIKPIEQRLWGEILKIAQYLSIQPLLFISFHQ